MSAAPGEHTKTLDLSVPIHLLPGWVYVLSLILVILPIVPYALVYGLPYFFGNGFGLWQIPAILVLIVAHEGVHAIGWKFASGLPWSNFTFGIAWKALAPYCHATARMSATAYRIGAILPLMVTGILPWALALLAGDAGWTFMSAIMISAAVGDIYVLWTLRDIPADALVQDHDAHAGCMVYLPE